MERSELNSDPAFAALSGSSRTAVAQVQEQEQFLPLDAFGLTDTREIVALADTVLGDEARPFW